MGAACFPARIIARAGLLLRPSFRAEEERLEAPRHRDRPATRERLPAPDVHTYLVSISSIRPRSLPCSAGLRQAVTKSPAASLSLEEGS